MSGNWYSLSKSCALLVLAAVLCSSKSHVQIKFFQKINDIEANFNGGLEDGDDFGESVTGFGDLDLDGTPDLAVSADGDDDGGDYRGAVYVFFLENRPNTNRRLVQLK